MRLKAAANRYGALNSQQTDENTPPVRHDAVKQACVQRGGDDQLHQQALPANASPMPFLNAVGPQPCQGDAAAASLHWRQPLQPHGQLQQERQSLSHPINTLRLAGERPPSHASAHPPAAALTASAAAEGPASGAAPAQDTLPAPQFGFDPLTRSQQGAPASEKDECMMTLPGGMLCSGRSPACNQAAGAALQAGAAGRHASIQQPRSSPPPHEMGDWTAAAPAVDPFGCAAAPLPPPPQLPQRLVHPTVPAGTPFAPPMPALSTMWLSAMLGHLPASFWRDVMVGPVCLEHRAMLEASLLM